MSGWNHRVIYHPHPIEPYYAIHEVYYTDGVADASTVEPRPMIAEDVEALRWTLNMMLKCLDKPVLDEELKTII